MFLIALGLFLSRHGHLLLALDRTTCFNRTSVGLQPTAKSLSFSRPCILCSRSLPDTAREHTALQRQHQPLAIHELQLTSAASRSHDVTRCPSCTRCASHSHRLHLPLPLLCQQAPSTSSRFPSGRRSCRRSHYLRVRKRSLLPEHGVRLLGVVVSDDDVGFGRL